MAGSGSGVSGVSGTAVAATAAGALLIVSGVKGWGVSQSLRSVLSGQKPAGTNVSPISGSVTGAAGPAGNTAPVVGPVNASETAWISALLVAVAAPPTKANINSIAGWIQHETSWDDSPPDGALYTKNPLNTTEPGFGATGSVNSVGVRIYPTLAQGLGATVAALTNGDYSDILAALRSGKGLTGTYQGLSTWSGGGYDSI
jgi:hypothetical protein